MNVIKKQVEYLKDNPKNLWFKRKLYGWGWTPVKWQGWVVILAYALAVIFLALTLDEGSSTREVMFIFVIPFVLLTITLIRVCYKKGEKPRWQWGEYKTEV